MADPSPDPIQWLSSLETRFRQFAKDGNLHFGNIDNKLNQLGQYLSQGATTPAGGLPLGASDLNDLKQKVDTLGYWLKVYEYEQRGVKVKPEVAIASLIKDLGTGTNYINPVKESVAPFFLATNSNTVAITASGTSYSFFEAPAASGVTGDVEIFGFAVASYTSISFRTRMEHTGRTCFLMNQPVHAKCMWGDVTSETQPGQQIFELEESIFLEPNQWLRLELTDFSGSTNTVELIALARRFMGYDTANLSREALIQLFYKRLSFPYFLTGDATPTLSTTTNAMVYQNYTLVKDFDFEIKKCMNAVNNTSSNANVANYGYRLALQTGRSGSVLTTGPASNLVHAKAISGTANVPNVWREPLLLKRGTPLVVAFNNDINTTANRSVDLVFHGRALPYMPAPANVIQTIFGMGASGQDFLPPFISPQRGMVVPRPVV